MNLVQGYGIEDIKAANLQQIVHVIQQLLFNQTNQENGDLGFWILVFSDFAEGLRSLGFRISGHGSGFRVQDFSCQQVQHRVSGIQGSGFLAMVPGLGFRIIACNNFSIRSNELSAQDFRSWKRLELSHTYAAATVNLFLCDALSPLLLSSDPVVT